MAKKDEETAVVDFTYRDEFSEPDDLGPGEEPQKIPTNIRAACQALAPEDALDRKQRHMPEELSVSEKKELRNRRLNCVRAAVAVAKTYAKGLVRMEMLQPAVSPWMRAQRHDAPVEELRDADDDVAEAYMRSDLVARRRKKPTRAEAEAGKQGEIIMVRNAGGSGSQIETYIFLAARAPRASKAASYLYSIAMAAAREFSRAEKKPSDYAHPLITATINTKNPRIA